jgi:competence protein ComEC
MRKLALAAVSFAGATVLAHYLLPDTAIVWCGAFFSLAAFLGIAFKGDTRLRIFIVSFGLAAGFLWNQAYSAVAFEPAKQFDGGTETVQAVVLGYPTQTDYGSKILVGVRTAGSPRIKTQLYAYGDIPMVKPGNTVGFTAKFRLADTMYGLSTDTFLSKGIFLSATLKGGLVVSDNRTPIPYFPAVVAHAVSEKTGQIFPPDVSGFMKSLLIGDTSGLGKDTELSGALSATGTSHIVSVSGMNVAFLMGLLGVLIKRKRLLAAVGIPVVLLFMAVVGFQAPVTRAGIMQLFVLAAPLLKRESDAITSVSASLLLILLFNPFSIGSVGLQLSFSATLGMIVCTGRINEALENPLRDKHIYSYAALKKALRFIIATLATTIGALVFSIPLIALHFGSVSLIAPLSNLAVLWAVELAFIGGIIAVAAAMLFAPVGAAAAFIVALPARFIVHAVVRLSHVPFASVYTSNPAVVGWLVTAYLMLAAVLIFKVQPRRWLLPGCLSVVTLCLILTLTSALSDLQGFSATALDVGQGQSVVITSGAFTEVVDCGSISGRNAGDILTKYLKRRGRTAIDLLVLTHYHEDHAGGITEVLERNTVRVLAAPDPSIDDGALPGEILTLAADKGIRVVPVTRDMLFTCGGMSTTLYAPVGSESENERGLAVLSSENSFDALITGDMDAPVESRLIAAGKLPDIELLVAGHHGSKKSASQSLLDAVTPEAAVISVGWNTYGHPSPETLRRLALAGIAVYRTDQDGTVTFNAP